MSVRGEGVPKPVRSFEEACFPDYLLQEIAKAGFKNPTPIQCQVRIDHVFHATSSMQHLPTQLRGAGVAKLRAHWRLCPCRLLPFLLLVGCALPLSRQLEGGRNISLRAKSNKDKNEFETADATPTLTALPKS